MLSNPERQEIDEHTGKLIVGIIALSLAAYTSQASHEISGKLIESISESYHIGGSAKYLFGGSLFAIAAFLISYNGRSVPQMIMSKIAAIAALGVAWFPCLCPTYTGGSWIHGFSAGALFLILALFCYSFFKRAKDKDSRQAMWRARIYACCCAAIVLSILILPIDFWLGKFISSKVERLVFYIEEVGLVAFGIAWLVASRALPLITNRDERIKPFS